MSDETTPVPAEPSRPGPKQLAASLGLADVEALAQRIQIRGKAVSRRTLYKWFAGGAPFTSEGELRAWLGNHGAPIGAAQPTLAESIAQAAAPARDGLATPAGQEASADKPQLNADGSAMTPNQQAAVALRDVRDLQAEKLEMELGLLRRDLVHRDRVAALVRELAHEVLTGLTDVVPRTLRALSDRIPAEYRPALREALVAESNHLRDHLTKEAPRLLREALAPTTGANP